MARVLVFMAGLFSVGGQWCGSKVVHRFGACKNNFNFLYLVQLAVILDLCLPLPQPVPSRCRANFLSLIRKGFSPVTGCPLSGHLSDGGAQVSAPRRSGSAELTPPRAFNPANGHGTRSDCWPMPQAPGTR